MGPGHVTFCFSFQFFIHYGFCILFSVNQWMLVSQHAWYCCYCSRCFWCYNKAWRIRIKLYSLVSLGPGEKSFQKNWVGVRGPLPKTLTLFMTKISNFPHPIYDLKKIELLQKTYSVPDWSAKTIPIYHKWPKSIPYLWPKRLKSLSFGATHTNIAHIREYSPPVLLKHGLTVTIV